MELLKNIDEEENLVIYFLLFNIYYNINNKNIKVSFQFKILDEKD